MEIDWQMMLDMLAILFLASSIMIVGHRRLYAYIKNFAIQSGIFAVIFLVVGLLTDSLEMCIVACVTFVFKVVVIPYILVQVIDSIGVQREIELYVTIRTSLLVAGGVTVLAYYITGPLMGLADDLTENYLPVSIAVMLMGLFLMVSRKKAVTQVVGLMVMENGLLLSAVALTSGMPLVVELGIAFDVLVSVIVMGIFLFRINKSFDSIDVDKLSNLRD